MRLLRPRPAPPAPVAAGDVRAGELLALVGPNGAEKSTLPSALAAGLPAAENVVRVHGRPALRRAVLPQSATLSFPFAVEEAVRMGRAPHAASPAEDDLAVAGAMAAAEVTAFAARPFSALSGGERARVALARVLAQQPPLLLLDEPTPPPSTSGTRSWCCGCAGSGRVPGTRWSSSCTTWASRRPTRTGSRRTVRRPRCW